MAKHIQLQIQEPCHENWNNMSPTEKGKFCGSCRKEVIDFTGVSDAELANFFMKHKSTGICGRMQARQVNQPIPIPSTGNKLMRYMVGIGLPALLLSCNNELQGNVLVGEVDMITTSATDTIVSGIITPPKTRKITGKVSDATGQGISQVMVRVKGTDYTALTDEKGIYTIHYAGKNNKPVIEITEWGYMPFSKKISIGHKTDAVAKLGICLQPATENPETIVMGLILPAKK